MDASRSLPLSARREDRGTAAQAAIVIDHAEAAGKADARVGHRRAEWLPAQLPDDLEQSEIASGGPGLADRQLPARCVGRERSVDREGVPPHEVRALPLLAEAEILDLHHADHGIIVVRG